jgi:hypothetical protein
MLREGIMDKKLIEAAWKDLLRREKEAQPPTPPEIPPKPKAPSFYYFVPKNPDRGTPEWDHLVARTARALGSSGLNQEASVASNGRYGGGRRRSRFSVGDSG